MTLTLSHGHSLSYVCPVCKRNTLPSRGEGHNNDPRDPERYKSCAFCGEFVPSRIRRLRSFQRRWDQVNANQLHDLVLVLERIVEELRPQSAPMEQA